MDLLEDSVDVDREGFGSLSLWGLLGCWLAGGGSFSGGFLGTHFLSNILFQ